MRPCDLLVPPRVSALTSLEPLEGVERTIPSHPQYAKAQWSIRLAHFLGRSSKTAEQVPDREAKAAWKL